MMTTAWTTRDSVKLAVSIIGSEAAGLIGVFFTINAIPSWYAGLQKPAFTPPNWLFGPVWVTLYLLMGIAAFLVWRRGLQSEPVRRGLTIFLVQLVLNAAWTPVFFGAKALFPGLVIIALLWIAILLTILSFSPVSRAAAWLLAPYLAWVSLATALNAAVWFLNTT